jgi:hypothetical protein
LNEIGLPPEGFYDRAPDEIADVYAGVPRDY